jgi:hypothetical protein
VNWDALTNGLLDELEKMAEIDTSAVAPETLEASQPQPMPSAAYEKASRIIQMAGSVKLGSKKDYIPVPNALPMNWQPPKTSGEAKNRMAEAIRRGKLRSGPKGQMPLPGMEKKSFRSRSPDVLPQLKTLLEEQREEGKKNQVGSAAGHVLGGAGASKFLHDWVDAGVQAKHGPHPTNMKHRFLAMSAGGATGAALYAHKRWKHRRAQKHKTSAKNETAIVKVPPVNSQSARLGFRGYTPDPFKKK